MKVNQATVDVSPLPSLSFPSPSFIKPVAHPAIKLKQESCAIAKMNARCALYK